MSKIDNNKFKMMISAFQRQLGVMPRSVSVLNTGQVLVPGKNNEITGDRTFVDIEKLKELEEFDKRMGGLVAIENDLMGGAGDDKALGKGKVEVDMLPGGQGLRITFKDKVTFDLGQADIKTEFEDILDSFAEKLHTILDKHQDARIYIEGHTDSVPLAGGVYRDNWGLSSARALSVLRYFEGKGYNPKQMMAVGLADTVPHPEAAALCGANKNCPANRRIVIRIQYIKDTETYESVTTFSEGAPTETTESAVGEGENPP